MMLKHFIDFKHIFLLGCSWLCFNSRTLMERVFFHNEIIVFHGDRWKMIFLLTFHKSDVRSIFLLHSTSRTQNLVFSKKKVQEEFSRSSFFVILSLTQWLYSYTANVMLLSLQAVNICMCVSAVGNSYVSE